MIQNQYINIISIFLSAVWVVLSAPAKAQDGSFYLRLEGGASFSAAANLRDDGDGITTACLAYGDSCGGKLNNIGTAGVFGVGIGYNFFSWLQTDITINYRTGYSLNDDDQGTPNKTHFHADINSYSTMLNNTFIYKIPNFVASPFLGFGVGLNYVDIGRLSYVDQSTPASVGSFAGGGRVNFAWQVATGLEFPLTNSVSITTSYRYFDGGSLGTSNKGGIDSVTGSFLYPGMQGHLTSSEALVGLIYTF
jgi:opacity protein-like surface antigen